MAADRNGVEGITRAMARIETIRDQVGMASGTFHAALTSQLDSPASVDPSAAVTRIPVGAPALGVAPTIGGPVAPPPTGIATSSQLEEYLRSHRIEERNGRHDASEVTSVSGGWQDRDMALLAPAAAAWEIMRADAAREGIDLRIVDGYRSWEAQAGAYEDFLAGRKKANVLPPGTSEHGNGLAVDVTNGAIVDRSDPEWLWLERNARQYGWHPISNETWHWEFRGV